MVRVFVNHVDTFTGRAISKVLGGSVVGSTVEDGDDEQQQAAGAAGATGTDTTYQVVGTLEDPHNTKPNWVTEILPESSPDDLLSVLLTCDIIVYHITDSLAQVEQATWAVQALHDQLSVFTSQKVFVCISTVMTWARSKPLDPEEPDVPFTEEDYRRRRPHPNFKNHIAAEKLIIKLGKTEKTKFTSYVLAAGLTYGEGENIFHFLFKSAWHGDVAQLPIFGDGVNVVPTIHALDLGAIVLNIADSRPKTRYILAADDSHCTLTELVKAISKGLGTGRTKHLSKEDALLNREISQLDFDQLQVNLQMEAGTAKEAMKIDWKSETGLVESLPNVIKDYKETRGLLPIRACILGPPAVGKTMIISQLCKFYKLHHIQIDQVIKEAVEEQERLAARVDDPSDLEEDSEDDGHAQEAQELLDLLKEDREANNGRYSEQYILQFYKSKLSSMPCQNQGFILDGFPKTYDQAKQLFAPDDAEDDDGGMMGEEEVEKPQYNKLTMPEVVISLEASDDFLKQRVMNLPQSEVEGTHNTEEGLVRRLHLYREQNEEDNTVLNYFDELEIHPEHISVELDPSGDISVDRTKKIIGEPRNYGPTPEERAETERCRQEELARLEICEREDKERKEAEEKSLRERREAEWNAQLAYVKREEQEMLETQSIPLRNYLMQHVMPTLTQGLIEVCKVKPDDAVDYLAEYLFKNNPQID